jgi:uncharacterized protein YodC (DUF2158 family)
MSTEFKKGDVVQLKAVIPKGPVEKLRMDEDGNVFYLISWVDASGAHQSRWFREDELKLAE